MGKEINYPLNWKRQKKDPNDYQFKHLLAKLNAEAPIKVPASINLSDVVPEMYDQGNAGSCVWNALAKVVLYHSRKQNREIFGSRLQGYYDTRVLEGTVSEDSGVYVRDAFKALQKTGVCKETTWPYDISKLIVKPSDAAYAEAQNTKGDDYHAVDGTNLNEIKSALAAGFPIVFGFEVFESFMYGKWDEIMPMPKKNEKQLGGHGVCFTKDTKVSLLDGRELSFEELLVEFKDKQFWVYSYDIEKKQIVPGLAHSVRKTGEQQQLIEVTLDNNEKIKCTLTHPFLLRDGTYKEAQYLTEGDSLMPLYKRDSKTKGMVGYEQIFDVHDKRWYFTHRSMLKNCEEYALGCVIHHKDFNKRNNSIDNLEIMSWDAHTKLHSEETIKLQEYAKSERGRQKSRELMSTLWANPEWKKTMLEKNSERGKRVTEQLKLEKRCGTQAFSREKLSKIAKQVYQKYGCSQLHTPEASAKIAATRRKKFCDDPEFRETLLMASKKNLQEYNDGLKAGLFQITEAQREARRKNGKQNLTTEQRSLNAKKLNFNRWHKDKYENFEVYYAEKYPNNHKVTSINLINKEDVYDLTVDKYENFALSAGVFVHNCLMGYDDAKQAVLIPNSWGKDWKKGGYFWMPYEYLTNPKYTDDFQVLEKLSDGNPTPTPTPTPTPDNNVVDVLKKIYTGTKDLNVDKNVLLRIAGLLGLNQNLTRMTLITQIWHKLSNQ